MPYTSPHMLLQWTGLFTQGGGSSVADMFTGSLRFIGPGVAASDNQATCDALATALGDWWGTQGNFIGSYAKLGYVKWNRIGVDGHYVNQSMTQEHTYSSFPQGSQSNIYPLQVAWAATYTTTLARGRASKGRTFFPTAVPVSNADQMRVSAGNCATFVSSVRQLVLDLNGAAQTSGGTVVAAICSNLGGGVSSPITGARVGNRLDIQRRRDNNSEETYSSMAITTEAALAESGNPLIP